MAELQKKMQEESFDVEVQYCNPDRCEYDCLTAPDWCNTHITSLWQKEDTFMENLEIRIQKTTFDVETQYCDPSDCYHDCTHEGVNNCDAHFTEIW